jgi:hypothetical protein
MSKRFVAGLLVLLLGGGGLATLLVVVLGGGSNGGVGSAKETGKQSTALSREGAELVALLSKGKSQTFHAKYRGITTDPSVQGQSLIVELWRKPPIEREDAEITVSNSTSRSAGFLLEDGVVVCSKTDVRPWSCRRVAGIPASGTETLVRTITDAVAKHQVKVRDSTVAGRKARCFTVTLEGGDGEICVSPDGIPLRISAGPSHFELIELSMTVPGDAFKLPATPATALGPGGSQVRRA